MIAKDLNGKEIHVGDRVFVDRDRESVRVIAIEPFTDRKDAYWIKVDDPINGPQSYFDISVAVDETSGGVTYRETLR